SGTVGGNNFTKNGTGVVQFVGNNRLNTTGSNVTNTVDVQGGTFRVAGGATFDASGAGIFNVASNATLAGQGRIIAGNNGFKINGKISPDNDRFEIPNFNTTDHSFETARTAVDNAKKYGTLILDGHVQFDGATLQVDLSTASVYDTINITGTVTFGTNKNIISVDSWDAGNFSIFSAASIAGATPDDRFSVELQGQTLSPNDYVLSYISNNSVLNLQTFKDQKPDNFYVWDEETDRGGNLDADNFPNDVIVHYSGNGLEDVTVNDNVELAGLIVSTNSDYHFHGQTKDSDASIVITENPEMSDQRFNGKLAVIGNSHVDLDLAVDAANGNYFQDSTVTISNSKALGTFEQDRTDETKSAGQTTVAGTVTLEINGNIETETRFVVAENAVLNIAGNDENAVKFSGVVADDINGAAFSLENGSSLSISGNTVISENKTSGEGGGIYAQSSTVVLDSSEGGIEITDNIDTDTKTGSERSSDIVLAGEENTIAVVGENETTTGAVIGSINAAENSSGNKLTIETDSFLQTGESKLNDKPSANSNDNQVEVAKGQWRVRDTFDVGGSFVEVSQDGSIAGNGEIVSSDFQINGSLTPDSENYKSTTTVIKRENQTGTLTLNGTDVSFDGAQINVELIGSNQSDKVVVSGTLNYGTENNIVNVNSWANGTYAVLESTNIDTTKFDVRVGNEEISSGSRMNLALQQNGNELQVTTSIAGGPKTLVWNGNENDYLSINENNFIDAENKPTVFTHLDYLIFGETAATQTVTLGSADGSFGGRTTSGVLINGDYKFTGGDLFAVKTAGCEGNLIIAAGNVTFENHVFVDGKIELLNGSQTTLLNKKAFHAGENFTLAETATLFLEPGDNLILAKNVALNGTVLITGKEPSPRVNYSVKFNEMITATESTLNAGQLAEMFNYTRGLLERKAIVVNDAAGTSGSMTLQYSAIPLALYAETKNFTKNETALATYFGETFNNWQLEEFETDLMQLDDAGLKTIFENLSGAAIYAEARQLALYNPYRLVASHGYRQRNNFNSRRRSSATTILGSCARRQPSTCNFWFTSQHSETEQNGDGNADRFNVSRTGMMIGAAHCLSPELSVGGVFGYGNARLHQLSNKIEADDYTFGLYAQSQLNRQWQFNSFVSYGNQNYQGDRYLLNNFVQSDYNGNSFAATLELVRSLNLANQFTLLPTFAAEYQRAATNNFTETGTTGLMHHFASGSTDQFILRFGLNSHWQYSQYAGLHTRLQYGRRMNNSNNNAVHGTITGSTASEMILYGVKWNRDLLNIGVGGHYQIDQKGNLQLFGNYDFDRGNRSKSHTAELGFVRFF
ncbi:MAG: autotransporter outer membrane beta-barrel domain-containing protein, partial [Planctomycetaceae bacterium]|nr:autotransporter outer membrane beta-barrel domain-containing protein [Planctomycetaceae bacterium]